MNRKKTAFTLIEILIVVAVLGILAALVVPQFQDYSQRAKESAAKESLRLLRNTIELYAIQHGGVPPGYVNNNTDSTPTNWTFILQIAKATNELGQVVGSGTGSYDFGPYLSNMPANPFNKSKLLKVMDNSQPFPLEATGQFGWIYKPTTKEIRLDWPETDTAGLKCFEY